MEMLLIAVIVASATSAGGLIAMLTKSEMRQYRKWIKFSELAIAFVASIMMLTFYFEWTILLLFVGAFSVIFISKYIKNIWMDQYIKTAMFGLGLGILFNISRKAALAFGIIVAFYNMIKGSRAGAYFMSKKKNIFFNIGNFQALFIISAMTGYFLFANPSLQASALNFAAGAAVATIFGTKL